MAAFSSNAPQLAADEETSTKVADEVMDSIRLFDRASDACQNKLVEAPRRGIA